MADAMAFHKVHRPLKESIQFAQQPVLAEHYRQPIDVLSSTNAECSSNWNERLSLVCGTIAGDKQDVHRQRGLDCAEHLCGRSRS